MTESRIKCPYCKGELDKPYERCQYCGWKKIYSNNETFLSYFIKEFKKNTFENSSEYKMIIREKLEKMIRHSKYGNPGMFVVSNPTFSQFLEYIKTCSTTIMSKEDLREYFDFMTNKKDLKDIKK